MTLRVKQRRSSVPQMLASLAEAGIPAVHVRDEAIALLTPRPVHEVQGFVQGWWSVQALAAQQAGLLLPVQMGMCVLDAVAALGGIQAHFWARGGVARWLR